MGHDLLSASHGPRVVDVAPPERRGRGADDLAAEAPRPLPLPPTRPGPVVDRRTSAAEALAQIEATLRDAAHAADPLAEAAARLRALEQTADVEDRFSAAGVEDPFSAADDEDPFSAAGVEDPFPAAAVKDPFSAAATRLRSETAPLDSPRTSRHPQVEDASEFAGSRVTPWGASIERRLARYRGDGLPFAVLCLELIDADRLVAADVDGAVVGTLEAAEAAILAQLRPADALIRERTGRYWLTAPDTDGADARALGQRIASAVGQLPPHRGAPLQVCVGVTTCPADGSDATSLEDVAEEALFTARAAGLRVAGAGPGDDD
jgi:GGDEF domain-containing protein